MLLTFLLTFLVTLPLIVLAYLEGISPSRLTIKFSSKLPIHTLTMRKVKIVFVAVFVILATYWSYRNINKPDDPVAHFPPASVVGKVREVPPIIKPKQPIKNKTIPKVAVQESYKEFPINAPIFNEEAQVVKDSEFYKKLCNIYKTC